MNLPRSLETAVNLKSYTAF